MRGASRGPLGSTRERSTFTRRDALQALAEVARNGASVAQLERQAVAFLSRGGVVELEPHRGERRFTTRALLEIERGLLEGADARRTACVGVARAGAVAAALGSRSTMSREQRALVVRVTRGGEGVQVVRAPAGTGKTFALDAAVKAWRHSGIPVLGCALSARAACELRDQAGVDATTIARLRLALDRGAALSPGSVLIVDEAGMVGTRDLARLADAAASARAKLLLVGDDRQLPEIEAGGAFRALAERLGAIELRAVRRQREAWDRSALAALRSGELDRFATEHERRGRIVAAPTAEAARAALVDDWWAASERGASALMIAHRRRDVADLNARARERMRQAGRIGDDELSMSGRAYAVGARVVTTRNDHRIGLVNGQAGVVVATRGARMRIRFEAGRSSFPSTTCSPGTSSTATP